MKMATRLQILILAAILCFDAYHCAAIPRNYDPRLSEEVMLMPKKRPFCNAFTGCGRKRSLTPPGMPIQEMLHQKQFADDDSLFDSDSAIDDLSRQIFSEAKLWEALQEAGAEMARRKQKEISYNAQ